MSEMIERMARAMSDVPMTDYYTPGKPFADTYRLAFAAIEAMRIPTLEIVRAGCEKLPWVARQVERAVIIALADRRAAKSSPEWFEIDWREMYNTVDACVLRETGRPIPGISSWRDRAAILGPPFSVATLRRKFI